MKSLDMRQTAYKDAATKWNAFYIVELIGIVNAPKDDGSEHSVAGRRWCRRRTMAEGMRIAVGQFNELT
jgi:hypothetical protein